MIKHRNERKIRNTEYASQGSCTDIYLRYVTGGRFIYINDKNIYHVAISFCRKPRCRHPVFVFLRDVNCVIQSYYTMPSHSPIVSIYRRSAFLLIFWMIYWYASKCIFLAYQFPKTAGLSAGEIFQSFVYGSRLDLSMTAYVLALHFLLAGILFFSARASAVAGRWLQYISIVLFSIIQFANLELYRNWGFHIDTTPLLYIGTPKEMMASVPMIYGIGLVVGAGLWSWLFIALYRRFVDRGEAPVASLRWFWSPVLVISAASMFIPIRGGIGIVALNAGSGYFSQKIYANHLTVNPVWNFEYSISKLDDLANPHVYMADSTAVSIASRLRYDTRQAGSLLKTAHPNIVFIVLESFTAKVVGAVGGEPEVTPQLNALAKEGILFTNTYTTSDRSDKGLVAIFSGVPALPTLSMNKFPQKTERFTSLVRPFTDKGYSSAFYYGGNVNFANLKSYLMNVGFNRFTTMDDFPSSDYNSKWGVHDHLMFQRFADDLSTAKAPFFSVMFTLSSHEPFDVPLSPARFAGSEENQFRNSVYYADSCLGDFFRTVRKMPLWDSTLFIVLADHGSRHPGASEQTDIVKYRIPMLWLGGALASAPHTEAKLCSQTDIAASLLAQVGMPSGEFQFSNNIFSPAYPGMAFFAYNNGFGMMSGPIQQIRDNRSGQYYRNTGAQTAQDSSLGLAYLQSVWLYFMDK